MRYGFLQRSCIYWSVNHEATEDAPGIAVVQVMHKPYKGATPFDRPGVAPIVITWAELDSLRRLRGDIADLRRQADVVIASFHWGYRNEVLQYMKEIAEAAIDSGADIVVGHGPHYPLAISSHRGKPIFYGVGPFLFRTGHDDRKHEEWLGLMPCFRVKDGVISDVAFSFVRPNPDGVSVFRDAGQGAEELRLMQELRAGSAVSLQVRGSDVRADVSP